jgi:hypothetical protein
LLTTALSSLQADAVCGGYWIETSSRASASPSSVWCATAAARPQRRCVCVWAWHGGSLTALCPPISRPLRVPSCWRFIEGSR